MSENEVKAEANTEQVAEKGRDHRMEEEYARARRRVMTYKVFYVHALVYAAVNSLLLLIDVLTGASLWFFWPVLGWGIGLAAHAGTVWGAPYLRTWEEKMIEQELSHLHR